MDPVVSPWQSPYSCFDNNSIFYSDPFGDVVIRPKYYKDAVKYAKSHHLIGTKLGFDKKGKATLDWVSEDAVVHSVSFGHRKNVQNNSLRIQSPTQSPLNSRGGDGAELARRIINSGRVTFSNLHPAPPNPQFRDDDANADDNINDAASGNQVHTSAYGHARGVLVNLNPRLLSMIDGLSGEYTLGISELAGARHSSTSRHYAGIAVDITSINGIIISSRNPYYRALMNRARAMGATEVLGPGTANHGGIYS